MNSSLNWKVRLAFGFAILTLLLMGSLSYRWVVSSDESGGWARHTHDVLENIQDLNLAMETIESASLGFALTGKESTLDGYDASISKVNHALAELRVLTAVSPTEQIHFPFIETLASKRIQHADMLTSLRRSQGISAAAASVANWRHEQFKSEFQAKTEMMRDEEERLLALRLAETHRDRSQTRWILIFWTLLGMLIISIAARSVLAESQMLQVSHRTLRESEEKYRMLLDGIQDYAIIALDPQGHVSGWSASAERMKGYTADEIIGRDFSCFFLAADIERGLPEEALKRAATTGLHEEVGMRVRKDGSEFLAKVAFRPQKDATGNLRGFSEICHDLTEVANSEARYRGLLEAAPDGMVVVNQDGEVVLMNARAEKQFGYHRHELLGKSVEDIIPEGFAERLIADALRTTAEALAQQIGTGIELHGRRKDGTLFPIEIMLSPLKNPEGVLVTAAIRDTSERKQLERQLHQCQKMEAVGQLTSGIAHDFNNLLTVIIGNLFLLDQLVSDNPAAVKRIKTAGKAAARGADITRRLLVFSSNVELKPASVVLADSIQNVIEMASRGLGLDVKITTQLDHSVPSLFVDPSALESALLNLVVNSRDAMPNGGSIMISSELKDLDDSDAAVQAGDLIKGCHVRVSVVDTGQGMSSATIERACEPFFTTKPRNVGTGLGLAMVYGFVKKSGGVVRIQSVLGQGTTISFYLPLAAHLSCALPESAVEPFNTKLSGTVLVVDDEVDILEVALAYLTEMGFTTLQAQDGASALSMIMEHAEIDLLITDTVLPGEINGAELGRRVRVLRPDLKIIHSSGFPAEVTAENIMPATDGPMLRKPYQRTEFAAIVRSVIEGSNDNLIELENSHSGS